MVILLTIVHVIVCFFLVIVVLLQSGKAADLAGAFGGMGSQTAFGPRGAATVLSKATTVAAGLFMVTSLTLAIYATRGTPTGGSSVLGTEAPQVEQSVPAAPSQDAPASGDQVPSVTLTDPSTGESVTRPLDIPPAPTGEAEQPETDN